MNIKTLALILLAFCAQPVWSATPAASPTADSGAVTTRLALRDLWVEHIFWIRDYALANQSADQKQAKVAADQVVANATKIANSIAPLYGQPAADQLLKLLAGHWGAVKHYSDATVAKDAKGKQAAVTELTSNAKAIATFLATANPNLPEATLVNMLSAHGGHHIAQIDEFAAHDYAGADNESQVLRLLREEEQALGAKTAAVQGFALAQDAIFAARREVSAVHVSTAIDRYLINLINATRHPADYDADLGRWIALGASPRGGIGLDRCARADAWLQGQDFVSPDNVRAVVHPVLRHRLQLSYDAVADGVTADQVLDRLLDKVAIPA